MKFNSFKMQNGFQLSKLCREFLNSILIRCPQQSSICKCISLEIMCDLLKESKSKKCSPMVNLIGMLFSSSWFICYSLYVILWIVFSFFQFFLFWGLLLVHYHLQLYPGCYFFFFWKVVSCPENMQWMIFSLLNMTFLVLEF